MVVITFQVDSQVDSIKDTQRQSKSNMDNEYVTTDTPDSETDNELLKPKVTWKENIKHQNQNSHGILPEYIGKLSTPLERSIASNKQPQLSDKFNESKPGE